CWATLTTDGWLAWLDGRGQLTGPRQPIRARAARSSRTAGDDVDRDGPRVADSNRQQREQTDRNEGERVLASAEDEDGASDKQPIGHNGQPHVFEKLRWVVV